jgi:DNA-binding PadR family transcriptional regulator
MTQKAKNRKVSNPLGLAVLALLFERPMHPYEMAATLRERHKEESIKLNYGSLYTLVGALERARFIEARQKVRESARPERTVYALTAEGRAELHDWLRELLGIPVKEYSQFEAALSLMPVLPPEEVAVLLHERLRRLDEDMQRLRDGMETASQQGVERVFLIETEYIVAMRQAERAWVAVLLDLVQSAPEFTRTWKAMHARHGTSPVGPQARRTRRRKKSSDKAS